MAPGLYLIIVSVGLGLCLIGWLVASLFVFLVGLVASIVAVSQLPVATLDCRGSCPKCGAKYLIRPWSM